MSQRTRPHDTTAGRTGIYQRIGQVVVRWPWVVVGLWIAIAVTLSLVFPTLTEQVQRNPVDFAADAPVTVTGAAMADDFKSRRGPTTP